jgi:hypothetical protein
VSNFQSPYTPPGDFDFYSPPWPPQALTAARRAAMLMFILAGLALAVGTLFFCGSLALPGQMSEDQRKTLEELVAPYGMSIRAYFVFSGFVMCVPGLILVALGIFVRRGKFVPIVMAIVVDALMLAVVVISIFKMVVGRDTNAFLNMCPPIGAGFIMAFLMARLIAAAKASRQAKAMQWQYWQPGPPGANPPS